MFIFLSKKIAIPNNTIVKGLAWNKDQGYIACGGDGGLLKVLKLDICKDGKVTGMAAPTNLSMNQTLDGHSGAVEVVTWNEPYVKLTSSDQNGLIMVWMLHKGTWYEEMINNRNKSVVKGMKWNSDGQKICIVYDDGAVIVGSVDGNRIWGKELKGTHLSHVEWSPDGKFLLFGMQSGEVHIYEHGGTFVAKLALPCMQTVMVSVRLVGIHWFKSNSKDSDSPSLAIAYDNGRIQLMRHENDDVPVIVDTDIGITSLDWNHDGTILAVTGKHYENDSDRRNIVKFYSPFGQLLHALRVPGRNISGCSWEGGGLRIALAVDSFIFFANIRPDYKWCYFSNTVTYAYTKNDRIESTVIFWNLNTNERFIKFTKHLLAITASGEFCSFATKNEDSNGKFAVILCNAIGTPVESRYIDIEPCFLAMNSAYVFVASHQAIYSWHFHSPKGRTLLEFTAQKTKLGQEKLFHVDDSPSGISDTKDKDKIHQPTKDPICCVTASEKILIVGRESGTFQRYLLPQVALTHRYNVTCKPLKTALNCSSSRMSIIDMSGMLMLYDLDAKGKDSSGQETVGELLKFERKDVWDVKWATDNSEMFALMEKTRMYVFRDLDPEEPVMCSGYMCSFEDLQVKAVLLDELMQNPESPSEDYIIQNEVKSLRDSRDLLEKVGINEAAQFIEDNAHPRLWRLLAEAAIQKMDFQTAEAAFVRCKDYQGIQFVKKVSALQNETMRKAEVAAYFKEYDLADKLYLEIDRRDLAIGLRRLLGDWFRVVQLLKSGTSGVDDRQLEEAWNAIGDFYADRQKWENAVTYYVQGHNEGRLAECYYMMEDYSGLQNLANGLTENHPLLPDLGSMFASVGMCEQAVLAYIKCNKVKAAIDCCVALNQWNMAINLAQKHNIKEIDTLLAKYAKHLLEKKKVLSAVELYRKAYKFLDAAHMMFKLAQKESEKGGEPLRIKKMYVLAAMLVEEHQSHLRESSKSALNRDSENALAAINALLDDDSLQSRDPKLMDQPWKGSEAYHFLLLAQRQLYEGYVDAAMKTALHLRDYEDVLNQEDIYTLLALSSCANRAFATCSKAFIKLESLENLSAEQRQEYEDLAVEIFLKHSPKDARSSKAECAACETMIPDWCSMCPSCNAKFPICVATGRPIMDSTQQWTCGRCKHSAHKQDMISRHSCPLCHAGTTPL